MRVSTLHSLRLPRSVASATGYEKAIRRAHNPEVGGSDQNSRDHLRGPPKTAPLLAMVSVCILTTIHGLFKPCLALCRIEIVMSALIEIEMSASLLGAV